MSEEPPEPTPPRRRFRWLRHEAIDLGDVVVQIIAVVIGILLALFINHWHNQRQQQAAAAQAIHAIHAELENNRQGLHSNVAVLFGAARQMLDSPLNRNQPPRSCPGWKGGDTIGVPDLTDAAYRIALSTHALSYLPFKQALLIAQVYGAQSTFKQLAYPTLVHFISEKHSLVVCSEVVVSFARNEESMDAAYALLIGPDKTKWPTPPSIPPIKSSASKQGSP